MNDDSLDEEVDDDDEDDEDWDEDGRELAVAPVTEDNEDGKHCWVCFASEEDDPQAQWTHPCKYVVEIYYLGAF